MINGTTDVKLLAMRRTFSKIFLSSYSIWLVKGVNKMLMTYRLVLNRSYLTVVLCIFRCPSFFHVKLVTHNYGWTGDDAGRPARDVGCYQYPMKLCTTPPLHLDFMMGGANGSVTKTMPFLIDRPLTGKYGANFTLVAGF